MEFRVLGPLEVVRDGSAAAPPGVKERTILARLLLEPGALGYLRPDSVLEREPLERLAADGALAAYRHSGFWRCLDTAKDAVALEEAGPGRWLGN